MLPLRVPPSLSLRKQPRVREGYSGLDLADIFHASTDETPDIAESKQQLLEFSV